MDKELLKHIIKFTAKEYSKNEESFNELLKGITEYMSFADFEKLACDIALSSGNANGISRLFLDIYEIKKWVEEMKVVGQV